MLSIAKYLSIADVGNYGIYVSIITISLYFVGLDFYTFSTREILKNSANPSISTIIYNQFIFLALSYLILLMVWPIILSLSGVKIFGAWLFLLTISEHLSQELYRILVIKSKITFANFILFLRSGLWCYISVPLIYFNYFTLHDIFLLWIVFSLGSVVLGAVYIYITLDLYVNDFYFNLSWLLSGIKISIRFFVGTLCLRGIYYFDKVIAINFVSSPDIGIYVFYFGITSAVQAVIDVLVVTRYYPDMVSAIQSNDRHKSERTFSLFKKKMTFFNLILYVLSIIACYIMVTITDKIDYISHFGWFLLIVLSNILINLSMPFHYILYAKGKDNQLIIINVCAFMVFIISAISFSRMYPYANMLPILISLILVSVIILITKFALYKKGGFSERNCLN